MTPIRVLIVDDSVVIRRLVSRVVDSDPGLQVVGTAAHGGIALTMIEDLEPDIITLDVEMPEMDGLETLAELRNKNNKIPVIMFSTLTERGSEVTIEALSRGASDYVAKPSNVGGTGEALERLQNELLPKIKALVPRATPGQVAPAATTPPIRPPMEPSRGHSIDAVVIGSSTGGPSALNDVFSALRKPLDVPAFIVQHIPPVFSRLLAERLDRASPMQVVEAAAGMTAEPGVCYLAPGGEHMVLARQGTKVTIGLNSDPPVNSCRPSVDVLFDSAAEVYGRNQLGVILTGMGSDGLRGCETLHELGAPILSQDQATSTVWGMPAAVTEAGLADEVLAIGEVADRIASWSFSGPRNRETVR